MKRLMLAAAAVLAGTLATAASTAQRALVPNIGIGPVKLGMTLPQVKAKLGPPMQVNMRARLSGGRRYVEYIWNYSEYRVGFAGGKPLRVVLVGTTLRAQRTRNGVGIGTRKGELKQKLGAVPCRGTKQLPGGGGRFIRYHEDTDAVAQCVLGGRGGSNTVFLMKGVECETVILGTPKCVTAEVKEVFVTKPY